MPGALADHGARGCSWRGGRRRPRRASRAPSPRRAAGSRGRRRRRSGCRRRSRRSPRRRRGAPRSWPSGHRASPRAACWPGSSTTTRSGSGPTAVRAADLGVADPAGEQAGPLTGRLGEIPLEQVGRGGHVGVDEDAATPLAARGTAVAGEVGALALGGRRRCSRRRSGAPNRRSGGCRRSSPSHRRCVRAASTPRATASSLASLPAKGTTTSTEGRAAPDSFTAPDDIP